MLKQTCERLSGFKLNHKDYALLKEDGYIWVAVNKKGWVLAFLNQPTTVKDTWRYIKPLKIRIIKLLSSPIANWRDCLWNIQDTSNIYETLDGWYFSVRDKDKDDKVYIEEGIEIPLHKESNKWDNRFMNLAKEISTWSKDYGSKVGALAVSPDRKDIILGYNGFPSRIIDDSRLENYTDKHNIVIHAEMNVILNAKRNLQGYSLYTTRFPCLQICTRHIIQAEFARVVYLLNVEKEKKYIEDIIIALKLFEEANIKVVKLV